MHTTAAEAPALDLAAVRRQFPALRQADEDEAAGRARPWVLFDNAGGSQTLGRAVERVVEFLTTSNVQLGGSYAPSRLAAERVEAGTHALAGYLGAEATEVVLGPSSTQLLANLAQALAPTLRPGDEIVVTDCDHESNIGPWQRLAAHGVVIREWKLDRDSLSLRARDLEPLLNARTRLVCFTQVSNLLGAITPVAELTRLVHAHGAAVCVDGVAYASHRPLDVAAWDVDYYVFSLYKMYGPHFAALYGKRARLLALGPINHYFIHDDDLPERLQPGHVNYEYAHALPVIVDYMRSLSPAAVAAHEGRLQARLLDGLARHRAARVIGPTSAAPDVRVPTVSFTVAGRHAQEIVRAVDEHHIGIKGGDFYSRRLVDALDLGAHGGVVRVSMVHYNTLAEVDRLLAAFDAVL